MSRLGTKPFKVREAEGVREKEEIPPGQRLILSRACVCAGSLHWIFFTDGPFTSYWGSGSTSSISAT